MIWKILGCFGRLYDKEHLNLLYDHKSGLTREQQAKIFSLLSNITAFWATAGGALSICGGLACIAAQSFSFTYATVPLIALTVAGFVLLRFAEDLSKNGKLALTLANQGGVDYMDEINDPFPVKYLIKQSNCPAATSFLINNSK